jgi:hypothetical protein
LTTSSSSSSSIPVSLASTPVSLASITPKSKPPTQKELKSLFKKLCRSYLKKQAPLAHKEMEPLWMLHDYLNFEDVIKWRDEVGVKKGMVFEDGKVMFNEWLVPPHEHIGSEINTQFIKQFSAPFSGTPHYPFINNGTTGIYLLPRMNLTS